MTRCPDCRQETLVYDPLAAQWRCSDARCNRYIYEMDLCREEGFRKPRAT